MSIIIRYRVLYGKLESNSLFPALSRGCGLWLQQPWPAVRQVVVAPSENRSL